MPFVQSDTIEAVIYDETAHQLRTKFRADGKVRIYENVPQNVYDSLIFADSISAFFEENIEGAYRARDAFPGSGGKTG
jgi:hypothetical protein